MDRKEFFAAIGFSATGIALASCMSACKKEYQEIIAPVVNFTLDLSLPENDALKTNGGYIYINGVIVARTVAGVLIAVAQACTHTGTSVIYQNANNLFICPNHGATFTANGDIIQGPVSIGLKQYAVAENGIMATVVG